MLLNTPRFCQLLYGHTMKPHVGMYSSFEGKVYADMVKSQLICLKLKYILHTRIIPGLRSICGQMLQRLLSDD